MLLYNSISLLYIPVTFFQSAIILDDVFSKAKIVFENILEVPALILAYFPYKFLYFLYENYRTLRSLTSMPFGGVIGRVCSSFGKAING